MSIHPDYSKLPSHIQGGVKRYIENGVKPGDFLTAVICNDLKESFGRADKTNIERMFDIVSFFYNEAPGGCWGSKGRMKDWMKRGGWEGIDKPNSSPISK